MEIRSKDVMVERNMKKQINLMFLIFFVLFTFSVCIAQMDETDQLFFDDSRKNVGVYMDEMTEFRNFRLRPDILGWFENWYGNAMTNKLNVCAAVQFAVPMISWQPNNIPLREIADGKHDAYIINYLNTLTENAPDIDILLRFAHEMELRPKYKISWYSWQAERDPDAYIAAWRHIVDLGHQINPRIKWVWSPNKIDEYAAPFYPGDEYVDYIGITLNMRETNDLYYFYKTFEEYYKTEGSKRAIEKYNKKIIISEVAYSGKDQDAKRLFIRSIFDYLLKDPNLAGVVFFNENKPDHNGNYNEFNFTETDVYLEEFNQGLLRIRDYRIENGID